MLTTFHLREILNDQVLFATPNCNLAKIMFRYDKKDGEHTFVLVPGGWCGGWCWAPVAERLESAGHRAIPVTFTGSGERVHLLSPEISLDTYVQDIINLVKYNDLDDIVLVAHSLGGIPSIVVLDKIPDRIRHVVFVDSMLTINGECAMDLIPVEEVNRRLALAAHHDGISLPVPNRVHFADNTIRNWFASHMTPQPLRPYLDKVQLEHQLGNGVPATYLACTVSHLPASILSAARAREIPGWRYLEIHSGHNVQIHCPDELTEILIETSRIER